MTIDSPSDRDEGDFDAMPDQQPAASVSPDAWLNRQIEIEEHQQRTQVLSGLKLKGNLEKLCSLLLRRPDFVINGRLDCEAVAREFGSTPNQISVEWDRLKKRARSAA